VAGIPEGEKLYSYSDTVRSRLAETGVTPTARPIIEEEHVSIFSGPYAMEVGEPFDGRLPTVIRKLSLDQLSDLHVLFNAWFSYVSYQEKFTDMQKAEADRRKEFVEAKLKILYTNTPDPHTKKKRTDQQVRDATKTDLRYIEVNSFYYQMRALHACLEAAVKTAEQDLKTISREVTRVKMKQDKELARQYMSGRTSSRFERGEPAVGGSTDGFQRRYKRGRPRGGE
jgi:hypothetical protein